jgi:hypothetical protein
MPRITVDVSDSTYQYLEGIKTLRGISVSFQANQLIELALKERARTSRKRKKKSNGSAPPAEE